MPYFALRASEAGELEGVVVGRTPYESIADLSGALRERGEDTDAPDLYALEADDPEQAGQLFMGGQTAPIRVRDIREDQRGLS